MGRKRLTADQRRTQILDVAAREFAKTGLEITRVKDIAEICGVNEALVYQHFPCKDDLYLAAMEHAQTEMFGGWIAILDKSTKALEALRELELGRTRLIYENRHLATAIEYSALASSSDERMQQLNSRVFSAVQDLIEGLVRKGQEDGSIRRDLDPASVAYWIRGFSHLVNLSVVIDVKDKLPLDKAEEHLIKLMDLLKPSADGAAKAKKQNKKPAQSAKPKARTPKAPARSPGRKAGKPVRTTTRKK
jgi:AcrR family transcriptional regulator